MLRAVTFPQIDRTRAIRAIWLRLALLVGPWVALCLRLRSVWLGPTLVLFAQLSRRPLNTHLFARIRSTHRGNQGHQSDLTSACIACWPLGRFVCLFSFEVGLVESHIGCVRTFVVASEQTAFSAYLLGLRSRHAKSNQVKNT